MELNESATTSPTALKTTPGEDEEHMISNMLYDAVSVPRHEEYSQLRQASITPPSHKVKIGTNDLSSSFSPVDQDLPVYDSANYVEESNHPREGNTPQQEEYSQLRHPSVSPPNKVARDLTSGSSMPQDTPVYDSANYTDEPNQPVYAEADHPPGPMASLSGQNKHPSKSAAAYEELDDDFLPSNEKNSINLPVYDVAGYPPTHNVPSSSAYAVLEAPDGDGPTEMPAYDVTDHNLPPSLKQQTSFLAETANIPAGIYDTANYPEGSTTSPAGLYDTANYPGESTTPFNQYDYADTAVRATPSEQTSSLPSSKRHAYDYIDSPLDVAPNTVPSVYANTLPGEITAEAEAHYDFGP